MGWDGVESCGRYGLLNLHELEGGKVRLVEIRNPWGRLEWDGAWSDGAREWSPARRAAVGGYDGGDDGRFFMSWADFAKQFNRVYCCLLGTAVAPRDDADSAAGGRAAAVGGGGEVGSSDAVLFKHLVA